MPSSQVSLLFWKEVRQLTRNTGVMLTCLFMPAVLIVLTPVLAILASHTRGYRTFTVPPLAHRLPGLAEIQTAQDEFLLVVMPTLFVIASLLAPMLAAIYTLIVERERRTLELLLALPVLVGDIVTAKLIAILATAFATMLPMFLVDAVVIVILTPTQGAYVLAALFLVASTLVAASCGSVLLALLARDVRTATTYGATMAAAPLFLTALCIVFIPGLARFVVLGFFMLALAGGAVYSGIRWLTYERYVSASAA
jgi:ABC-2 type transport system permease protein